MKILEWIPKNKVYRLNFFMSIICAFSTSFLMTILPMQLTKIINIIFYNENGFSEQVYLYLLIFVLYILSDYIYTFNWQHLHNKFINKDLKGQIFSNIFKMNFPLFKKKGIGKLYSAVSSDADEVLYTIQYNYIQFISNTITVVLMLIILFKINYFIALLMILCAFTPVIITNFFKKSTIENSEINHDIMSEMKSFTFKFCEYLQDVKLNYSKEKLEFSMKQNIKSLNLHEYLKMKIALNMSNIIYIIQFLVKIIIYFIVAFNCIEGVFKVGIFYSIIIYIDRIQFYIDFFADNIQMFNQRKASLTNIKELLAINENDNKNEEKLDLDFDKIIMKNISYIYENGVLILDNINIEFNNHEITLINGKSGIGKSTILNIIMKNLVPYKGEVYVGAQNLRFLSSDFVRKNICYIKQNEKLFFNQSLRFNITLGKPVEDDVIISICKQLDIYTEINNYKYKLDTVLDNKIKLSDGQIQKMLLIRVLLDDRKIYLLDEITSNLDSRTVRKALQMLKNYKSDCLIILVAHDNSIWRYSDRVINFEIDMG